MFITALEVDRTSVDADVGATINLLATIDARTFRQMGIDPSVASSLSLKARITSLDGANELVAPMSLTPVTRSKGWQHRAALVVAANDLTAANTYRLEVYIGADLEPTVGARAKNKAIPKVIEHADTARRSVLVTGT